ncbi:MAG: hypothetical protein AAGD40_07440, partial [Pseudomonadota bacterium]
MAAATPLSLTTETGAVLIIAAAWLLFAVWTIIRSARIRAQAETAQAWGLRLRGLLATVPGAYLIIGDDGAVIGSDALRSMLGMDRPPTTLADLKDSASGGLAADDYARLEASITATAVSGTPFALSLVTTDAARHMEAEGRAAPPDVAGTRGVVVWFADASATAARVREIEMSREA